MINRDKLISFVKDINNLEETRFMIYEVNSYDNSLDYVTYYDNDEDFFDEMYQGSVIEAIRAVCFGNYNFVDNYVKIDSYGNLESCNKWELAMNYDTFAEEIVDTIIELEKSTYFMAIPESCLE